MEEKKETEIIETRIQILPNGPLLVHGPISVTNSDGKTEKKNNITSFCRCGISSTKPYCDGSHFEAGFKE